VSDALGDPRLLQIGALIVVVSDVVIRALLGADDAIRVPTGITTTIAGAIEIGRAPGVVQVTFRAPASALETAGLKTYAEELYA